MFDATLNSAQSTGSTRHGLNTVDVLRLVIMARRNAHGIVSTQNECTKETIVVTLVQVVKFVLVLYAIAQSTAGMGHGQDFQVVVALVKSAER